MRCPLCDYNPDTEDSLFHSSLALPKHQRRMSEDPDTGEITCNCFDSEVEYGIGSIEEEEENEVLS